MATFVVKDADLGRLTRRITDLVRRVVDGSVAVSVALNYVQRAIDSSKPDAEETVTFGGYVLTPELLAMPVTIYGTVYYRHPNGGGLVSEEAEVDPTAYVDFEARVSGKSKIKDQARIYGRVESSEIHGDSEIMSCAWVDHCRIFDNTKIAGKVANAWFGGKTYIGKDEIVESGRHENVIKGTPLPDDPWHDR